MKLKKILLLALAVYIGVKNESYAQMDVKSIVDVTPPNVSNFEKVNNVEINKATGTVNYDINLYSLPVEPGLNIPVTLNYNNNGFNHKIYQVGLAMLGVLILEDISFKKSVGTTT